MAFPSVSRSAKVDPEVLAHWAAVISTDLVATVYVVVGVSVGAK